MSSAKVWWNWIYDRLSHSYVWALFLAMNCADSIARADLGEGWHYLFDLFVAALFAKWAHTTWHRAEARRVAKDLAKRISS